MRKRRGWQLLLGMSLFLAGCGGGGGDSTAPPAAGPLASATIGDAGGSLTAGDFNLVIPPSAVPDGTVLSLYRDADADLPGASASDCYRLEGLPADIDAPLTLILPCNTPPTGDPLIGVGHEVTSLATGRTELLFTYLAATLDGNLLTCSWQPRLGDDQPAKTGNPLAFLYGPRDLEESYYPDGAHRQFIVQAPLVGRERVPELGAALVQAYQRFVDLGFDMTVAALPGAGFLPIRVNFDDAAPPPGGYVQLSWLSWPDDLPTAGLFLYTDRLAPTDLPTLEMVAGARLAGIVHRAQFTTDIIAADGWQRFWLEAAVNLWAEGLFAPSPAHVPADFDLSGWTLEQGLVGPMVNPTVDHLAFGRAMAALLQYLVTEEDQGAALLLRTYAATRTGTSVARAFLEAVAGNPADWWPGFLQALLAGEVYDVPADAFLDQARLLTMDRQDWQAERTDFCTQLGARLYRIDPAYDGWGEDSCLDLVVSSDDVSEENLTLLVFSLRDGEITHLATGPEVQVANLAGLHDDGADLLVLVSNAAWSLPDVEAAEVTLSLAVGDDTPTVIDASMRLYGTVMGRFVDDFNPQSIDFSTGMGHYALGSFDGDRFTGSWHFVDDETYHAESCTLSCRLDLEADPPRLLDWWIGTRYVSDDGQDVYTLAAEGGEVPYSSCGDFGERYFSSGGAVVCESISFITYQQHEGGVLVRELESYTCDENSLVSIQFFPWHVH